MKKITLFLIRLYQKIPKDFFWAGGSSCRFKPVCSEYCFRAVAKHGTIRGLWLCFKRLLKCNPFFQAGHDPVV